MITIHESTVKPHSLLASATLAAIRQMLSKASYDNCAIHLHSEKIPEKDYVILQQLHCVKWEYIEPELKAEISRILTNLVNSL